MRIPTLAALCAAAALSWACNPENQPGLGREEPAVEDRTGDQLERDATERELGERDATPRDRDTRAGMNDCPMDIAGTTVAMTEADGSIALTFKTTSDDVEDLRESVRKMGERWERRAMRRERREENAEEAGREIRDDDVMPKASTAIENVDGGARLVLVPEDASELDQLRERVRVHEERMSSTGKCYAKDQDEQQGEM